MVVAKLWEALKIYLFYHIVKNIKGRKLCGKKYLTILSLFLGTIIYKLAQKIVDKILCKIYDMRALNTIDSMFLSDIKNSQQTVVARFNAFDFDKMSNHLKTNFAQKIPGGSCRLVQMFGRHYWQNLSQEDLDELWPQICIKVEGIKSVRELNDYLAAESDKEVDLYAKRLPYQWYLVENCQGKGYVFLVATHAYLDGISILVSM
jgi:hypothetical protein